MTTQNVALNDALADAAVETLALYKAHMVAGRYADAQQCLGAVDNITGQVENLEERAEDFDASLNKSSRSNIVLHGAVAPDRP